jgi:tRNA G46 methylase TrmB
MGHHTGALIQTIKQFSQDFEFYPTTNEQLEVIKADLEVIFRSTKSPSILDIGAGNGNR